MWRTEASQHLGEEGQHQRPHGCAFDSVLHDFMQWLHQISRELHLRQGSCILDVSVCVWMQPRAQKRNRHAPIRALWLACGVCERFDWWMMEVAGGKTLTK